MSARQAPTQLRRLLVAGSPYGDTELPHVEGSGLTNAAPGPFRRTINNSCEQMPQRQAGGAWRRTHRARGNWSCETV